MNQHHDSNRPAEGRPAGPVSGQAPLRCVLCSNTLNAGPPVAHRHAVLRACVACEARYYTADLAGEAGSSPAAEPQPGLASPAALPSSELQRLRRLISVVVTAGELAHGLATPVTATPLDDRFAPSGVTLTGVVSDLTESWIRVTLPTDRQASYWLLDFGPSGHAGSQIAVRSETAAPVGDGSWRIAGAPAA